MVTRQLTQRMSAAEYNAMRAGKTPGSTRRKINRKPVSPIGFGGPGVIFMPLPYSKNEEYKNHHALTDVQQHWKDLAALSWAQLLSSYPLKNRARLVAQATYVKLVFFFPDNRRRDEGNYLETVAMKGMFDGLKGRMFGDDCYQELVRERCEFRIDRTFPRLEIHFRTEALDGASI